MSINRNKYNTKIVQFEIIVLLLKTPMVDKEAVHRLVKTKIFGGRGLRIRLSWYE